jgi:GDSL-like Lipase/Acylhydrolase family
MRGIRGKSASMFLLAALLALALAAGPAEAGPKSATTAAVSMGDSYISGEAGRWNGNSINPLPGNDGTDRACIGTPVCSVDLRRVYLPPSDTDGCHRSDVAEILSSPLPVRRRFNIACSGAVTDNIYRASNGGQPLKGEAPEADQLLPIARSNNVKLVMLSIGGNDLGFASIVQDCFTRYSTKTGPCSPTEQAALESKLALVQAKVEKAIDEVRAVMASAGYRLKDYRLVLQGYPSVMPRASEARYAEVDPERSTYGCPFYDADLDWARDQAVFEIGGMVQAAARARGAEFLGLGNAFQGHEVCSTSDSEVSALKPPSERGSEWGRALSPSAIQQGQTQEVFHPDAFGQQAIGACVGGVFARPPGQFACTGAAGISPAGMVLTRTS